MDFKVGDIVYCEESWSSYISKNIIIEIKENYAVLKGYTTYGTWSKSLNELYHTKEEAQINANKKIEEQIKEYKSRIKDVNDLVKFMYNYNISCCEEYTDWEARKAVEERAKELLNLEL